MGTVKTQDQVIISQYVKPLCCTPETHTVLYGNYVSKLEENKPEDWVNIHPSGGMTLR